MKVISVLVCTTLLLYGVNAQFCNNDPSKYLASDGQCYSYDQNSDKTSARFDARLDTGNTAWILAATALAMLMTPAIGLLYAGLYRAEHATNTIILAFVTLAVITVEWILFGYSFAFGPGSKGYGNFKWGVYHHVINFPSGVYATTIPHILYAAFQNMFAAMAPAFIAGAVVGRMKFGTYLIFVIAWTLVVYNCLAHWFWASYIDEAYAPTALGWLSIRGALDWAGGAVIHVASGFAALAMAIVIGKRRDYVRGVRAPPRPHNLPLVAIGLALLWFGWLGYTGGAGGVANGVAAFAVINTHIAASTSLLWWLILEYIVEKKITLMGAAYGALSGLVAITSGAGYVWPWHSLIFGIFAASFGFLFSRLKYYLRYDDPFDVFAVHGVCGCVGMFMTGLFATSEVNTGIVGGAFYGPDVQLGYQMAGLVVAAAFSFVCTYLIAFILKKTIGIRVSDKNEDLGLDEWYHTTPAYYFDEPVPEDVKGVQGAQGVPNKEGVYTKEGVIGTHNVNAERQGVTDNGHLHHHDHDHDGHNANQITQEGHRRDEPVIAS